MAKIINLEKHVSITSAQSIDKLCRPLREAFGIQFFRFLRLYKNGKRVVLSNEPDAIRYAYEYGNWVNMWYDGNFPEFLKPGWYTWHLNRLLDSREIEEKIENDLISILKVKHGVTLVNESKNYFEIFSFDTILSTVYQIDRAHLLRFTYYFKEQARKLIAVAEADGLLLQGPTIPVKGKPSEKVDQFLNEIKINRYYLADRDVYLTAKEIACIRWMAIGKTAEEIAMIENNTTKTIQRHVENIKNKLNCQKQTQIIKLFLDTGL
jgi:DNA-binding CsgD family transcriptional regulator